MKSLLKIGYLSSCRQFPNFIPHPKLTSMKKGLMLTFLFPLFMNIAAGKYETEYLPEKIITIKLLPAGTAVIGRDTLDFDAMSKELQQRLFRSYMGTGKMYDAIKLEFAGEVMTETRDAAKVAIQKAQQNTLKELCLEKHKKFFEDINSRQQEKIRKQFPVLFQTNFD